MSRPVKSSYTFEDFLERLERSPVSHMSPLYHENKMLFVNRPDMFTKAVLSVHWEKSLALVQAAYYVQPIPAETYRGVLARMLLHNKHVMRHKSGVFVGWQAALYVFNEAVLAHGTSLPTRMHISTLRLLAPHREWASAIRVLQLAQANEQLTKPMVLEAAGCCTTPTSWKQGLQLLMHVHEQEPLLISESISSLRPEGTSTLAPQNNGYTSLLSSNETPSPTKEQKHLLKIINGVVSATPWEVALRNELCFSYLTHLIASSTLETEEKTALLTAAFKSFPWNVALQLLSFTEPALLDDKTWNELQQLGPQKLLSNRKKKKGKVKQTSVRNETTIDQGKKKERAISSIDSFVSSSPELQEEKEMISSNDGLNISLPEHQLEIFHTSPEAASALVAVLIAKMPSSKTALKFVEQNAPETLRTSVVLHALVSKCAEDPTDGGWRLAVPLLLSSSTNTNMHTINSETMSSLIVLLRKHKRISEMIQLLQKYIVPRQCKLNGAAIKAMYEAILIHNQTHISLQEQLQASMKGDASDDSRATVLNSMQPPVHWLSALTWATDLQAEIKEDRILKTGTGPSAGAIAHHPEKQRKQLEKPFSTSVLSLLIHICALANSPQGALRAMGYARTVDKTELAFSEEIKAILYCAVYDRPFEAEAIVSKAIQKYGPEKTVSLQKLLETVQSGKLHSKNE